MARSGITPRARPSGGQKIRRKAADEIDIAVGRAVRFFRMKAGMTQATLGGELGVTFQQIQKYEKGVNRIGSGRLLKIAKLFNRPITAFYPISGNDGAFDINEIITLTDRSQTMRMLYAFQLIQNPRVRLLMADLAEGIAKAWTRGE
jgi:transcriptional regulator with XRE-family HTH domain